MRTAASDIEVTLRLAVYRREVARLPADSRGVKVREGTAWVTVDGQDKLLSPGDRVTFEPGRFPPVVTSLGSVPLILEVFGGKRPSAASLTRGPRPFSSRPHENPL
ncbi:MAG TPA: hypothetical protein VFO59_04365 [Dehalococcoidia bacterium]|nr:hypothetical protein [Dehalococcoidia bacterium]